MGQLTLTHRADLLLRIQRRAEAHDKQQHDPRENGPGAWRTGPADALVHLLESDGLLLTRYARQRSTKPIAR